MLGDATILRKLSNRRELGAHAKFVYRFSRNVIVNFNVNHDGLMAAGVAFYALLAILPALVLAVVIIGAFVLKDQTTKNQAVSYILGILPNSQARQLLANNLRGLIGSVLDLRQTAASVSGLILLYAVGRVFNGFHTGMDVIWQVEEGRSFIASKFIPFLTVLGMLLAVLASVVVTAILNGILSNGIPLFGIHAPGYTLFNLINLIASFVLVALMFALMYRYVPAMQVRWGDIWLGASIASLAWVGLKELFITFLPGKLIGFNPAYGTIGSLLAFVTWIYITMQIIFLGAEIAVEHARCRDHPILTTQRDDVERRFREPSRV